MTNIEKIVFDAKYRLDFVNGEYSLSGFDHMKVLHISEDKIYDILDSNLEYFTKEQWEDFIEDFKKL